jgi:glycerol-3-phosphate O-acyltransferase
VNLLARGGGRPIWFVPATLNYHLVLEAATLIDDYLKEAGKSRYIIEDDESTKVARVARYFRDMLRSESAMTIQFGQPLDVLGHRVSEDGVSHDDRGRPVDLRPFLTIGGEVRQDAARDAEYTRELGERIAEAFQAETHVLSTHLVAFVLFRMLRRQTPGDLFLLLRGAEPAAPIPVGEALATIGRAVDAFRALERQGKVRLGSRVAAGTPESLLEEAIAFFQRFHARPPIIREGEGITIEDRALLYYYHNRLTSYDLGGAA